MTQRKQSKVGLRGMTLVELLVVLAVIATLGALLFPAFGGAREHARIAACTTNLSQIGKAFGAYVDDHDGQRPKLLAELVPGQTEPGVLACATDPFLAGGGYTRQEPDQPRAPLGRWPFPISYLYPDLMHRDELWQRAQQAPGRPGYAVCVVHGTPHQTPAGVLYNGLLVRLCFDGSVIRRNVKPQRGIISYWKLLTDQETEDMLGGG